MDLCFILKIPYLFIYFNISGFYFEANQVFFFSTDLCFVLKVPVLSFVNYSGFYFEANCYFLSNLIQIESKNK